MSFFRLGTNEVEAVAQIGVGVAGIIGITVAIMRVLHSDDEYEKIIDRLNAEINRKDKRITELEERDEPT